jgi:hypothetical protein
MEDSKLNALLQEVRNCLMPTQKIEDMFNLTFKIEREKEKARTETGGLKSTGWDTIAEHVAGALDDSCLQEQYKTTQVSSYDVTHYALYCKGDVDVKRGDLVTVTDEKGIGRVLEVKAVRNPMMRYRYLVVWCAPGHMPRT